MAEKIIVGPEQMILDMHTYPITFGVMSSISAYREAISLARDSRNKVVAEANKRFEAAEKTALDELKKELK